MSRIVLAALLLALASPVMADGRHGGGGGLFHGGGGHDWHDHSGGGWHPGYNSGGYTGGGWAGGGFLGGVLGGIIANQFAPPPVVVAPAYDFPQEIVPGTPPWYAYCASKYRSFDPSTGTFLALDGIRRPCQ